MDGKRTGWGLFIIGAAVVVLAAVALVYLHGQHPGTLVKWTHGHRESLKSMAHWKAPTYVVAVAAIAGVVVAVAGLVKTQRHSDI